MLFETFENRSVMLVEDNPFETKLLLSVLQAFGFRKIITLDSVDDAIAELSQNEIDCILLDWKLPGKPGIELVDYVRKSKRNFSSDLPIVLCTGFTEMSKITRARDSGVDEIVAKPFSADKLYQKLHAAVFKKRSFIAVEEYIGPDRRRQDREFSGFDRRGERGMSQDQIDLMMNPDQAGNFGPEKANNQ